VEENVNKEIKVWERGAKEGNRKTIFSVPLF